MELTILERLLILKTLPKEGNIVTLRILTDLKRNLSLTEEEYKENNVRVVDDKMLWDNPEYKVEVVIGEKAFDIIAEAFTLLNQHNKLTIDDIPLYERFVEKKEDKL